MSGAGVTADDLFASGARTWRSWPKATMAQGDEAPPIRDMTFRSPTALPAQWDCGAVL